MSARSLSRTTRVAAGAVLAAAAVLALARCADPTADRARPPGEAASLTLDRPFVPPGLAAGGRWRREDARLYGALHTEAMEFAQREVRRAWKNGGPRTRRERCNEVARISRAFVLQSKLAGDRAAWIGMRAALDAPGADCRGAYDVTLASAAADAGAATAPLLAASATLQDGETITAYALQLADAIRAGGAAYLDQPDFESLAWSTAAQAAWLSDADRALVDVSAAVGVDSYSYWRYNMDGWGAPPPPDMSAFGALQREENPPREPSDGGGVPQEPDRRARAGALVDADVNGAISGAVGMAFALQAASFTQAGVAAIAGAGAAGALVGSTNEMVKQLMGVSRPQRPPSGYFCRDGSREGFGGWCVSSPTGGWQAS
jgi:hypothetical protein